MVAQQKVGNRLLDPSIHHQINSSDPLWSEGIEAPILVTYVEHTV